MKLGPITITTSWDKKWWREFLRLKCGPISYSHSWSLFLWRGGDETYGIFRNSREVIPGRWGWFFYGLEIGSRNPGNFFGVWLKRVGLWPW